MVCVVEGDDDDERQNQQEDDVEDIERRRFLELAFLPRDFPFKLFLRFFRGNCCHYMMPPSPSAFASLFASSRKAKLMTDFDKPIAVEKPYFGFSWKVMR